jgi:hypothetical protein
MLYASSGTRQFSEANFFFNLGMPVHKQVPEYDVRIMPVPECAEFGNCQFQGDFANEKYIFGHAGAHTSSRV